MVILAAASASSLVPVACFNGIMQILCHVPPRILLHIKVDGARSLLLCHVPIARLTCMQEVQLARSDGC